MIPVLRRRAVLAGAALAPFTAVAQADWRGGFRELRFAMISSENERDVLVRFEPFSRHFTEALGVPFRVFRATDYAATVEALRADQAEFGYLGPAAYALARRVAGEKIVPVASGTDLQGGAGYHSVIIVRTDAPYRSLADLRGRSFAWADPNSASGYAAPMFYLRREGVDPGAFFSRTSFSGNHEQSVIGLLNGSYDAVATWWTNEQRSNPQRMEEKGMIPPGQWRVVWKSPLIPNSPFVMRTNLPQGLKDLYVETLMALPGANPEAWNALTSGQSRGLVRRTHEDYLDMIAITEELDRLRRQRRT
ncbi:phosphate/phosphite/phosphonate ABC transporter substrate-binding protein [Elioraea tepidiphila]|uniref:phosphate/phosphite/phosphonate ABC transporter substrate-binding protein n=1 Tax=Elioraea tepidiphila TaxID=457934 RepID=UPI0003643305|nr:phosphate/phosphite/phosphonate ABC transporter substrate-binding protein [Elioraea tepidiphila]